MSDYILHNYYRSSTSLRVRVALNLKQVDYEYVAYHLRNGEQRSDKFLAINPQGLVPSLQTDDGVLSQSLAIIEYLDETIPDPALLPEDPWQRARVRSLAMLVGCDIHPINNLRILKYIGDEFGADDAGKTKWFNQWVQEGFTALEQRLSQEPETGDFCHGDSPGIADICLFAQMVNNKRFNIDTSKYQNIERIHANCLGIEAFQKALPQNQPDAE